MIFGIVKRVRIHETIVCINERKGREIKLHVVFVLLNKLNRIIGTMRGETMKGDVV